MTYRIVKDDPRTPTLLAIGKGTYPTPEKAHAAIRAMSAREAYGCRVEACE